MIAYPRCRRLYPVVLGVLLAASLPAYDAADFERESAAMKAKAEAGDAQAQCEMADWLEWGRHGFTQDEARAIQLYEKAANQGHQRAAFKLGMMYADGRGAAKNPTQAAKFFRLAAEAGDEEAQFHLGMLYAEDGGLPRNDAEAFKWFRRSADGQFSSAAYQVGHAYSLGLGVKRDTKEAVRWLKLAINLSVDDVEGELAELVKAEPKLEDVPMMELPERKVAAAAPAEKPAPPPAVVSPYGTNLPQETLDLIAKAEAGDAAAERKLAYNLIWGVGGLTVNRVKAAEWYRKGADRGNLDSQYDLAGLFAGSSGTDAAFAANREEALRWKKKAAEGGHLGAAMDLGADYDRGTNGVGEDKAESFKWYLVAAKHGSPHGQSSVGICYLMGSGVAADRDEGIKWLQKAAASGNSYAAETLARFGAPATATAAPAPAAVPVPAVNPDAYKEALAPIARRFETAFNAAADLAARERAVVKFSREVGAAGSKTNASKEQLSEFVLRTLLPFMESHLSEAGPYMMKIDSAAFDPSVMPRVLSASVLTSVRAHGQLVADDYRAQEKAKDAFRDLIPSARAGNVTAQLQVAEGYLRAATGLHAESFRLEAIYWFKQAHNNGQRQNDARVDQMVAPYKQKLVAALNAKDGPAALALLEAMGQAGYDTSAREAGLYLLEGRDGVEPSEGAALYWFRRAGELGNADGKLWADLLEPTADRTTRAQRAFANGEAAFKAEQAAQKFDASQPWFRYAASLGHQPADGRLKEIEVAKAAANVGSKDFDEGTAAYKANDFAKALASWKAAAELGRADAMFNVGVLFRNNQVANGGLVAAREWFAKAAAATPSPQYQKTLAEVDDLIAHGGVEQEQGLAAYQAKKPVEARKLFQASIEKGSALGMYWLGSMYLDGQGGPRDLVAARDLFNQAAAKGLTPGPANQLKRVEDLIAAGVLDQDVGFAAFSAKDFAKALISWKAGAAKGNADAMFNLGVLYRNGQGVAVDFAVAREWQAKAAALKPNPYGKSLAELDDFIAHGEGELQQGIAAYEARNFPEALALMQKSAAKGNADAFYNLGVLYQRGEGVARDLTQAAAWYDKAASAGHDKGKEAADRVRASLVGTDELAKGDAANKAKKYSEAIGWWEKSAQLGNPDAMLALGVFYMDGAGEIFADSDKAESWLKQASGHGNEVAGEYLKTVQMMAGLRAGVGATAPKAPPPKGASLVKGSKWTADEVLAALKRGADHESLAIALRSDGIDYYQGEYLRLMQTPEAAKIVEFGHLSMALVDGLKPGAGAWAVDMAKAAIAARRSQLKLAPRPADSAELRARAKAGDAAAIYALISLPQEQLKLGELPPELALNYPQLAQVMVSKNYAPGLWYAAQMLVNQVDKTKNDPVLQAEYLRRSAEAGDARGANGYAQLFFAPGEVSVAPNFAEAEQWLIEAGAREQPGDFSVMPPQLALTVLYSAQAPIGFSGTDLRPDDASLRWIRELIRRGGRTAEHAQFVLESWRRAKNPKPVDTLLKALPPEVAPWSAPEVAALEAAVKKGDAAAALKLAAAYESGRGVRQHDARAVELFLVAANKGSIPAMRAAAAHFASGLGVKKNPAERLAWLEKAGTAGDASAWRELGNLLHWARTEDGVNADYPRALAAYQKAIAGGDVPALLDLAQMHEYGRGMPKDLAKARELKLRAAEAGHAPARNAVARDFRDAKDFKNAAIWYRKEVEAGANLPGTLRELASALESSGDDAGALPVYQQYLVLQPADFQARFALGNVQERKRDFAGALASYQAVAADNSPYNFFKDSAATSVKRVKEELSPTPGGIVALRKQAEAGDANAMVELAIKLTPTDKPAAFEWLKKAAAKDHPGALLWLGIETAATDKNGALALVQKSAALGNLEAKFRIGVMQMQGKELPLDQVKGLALVTESADGGFAAAQYELGKVLVTGAPGITADSARGLAYLQKAALQGLPQAAAVLGEIYERGLNGAVSLPQAQRWYQEAVRGGLKQVEPALQRVQQQLNAKAKQ